MANWNDICKLMQHPLYIQATQDDKKYRKRFIAQLIGVEPNRVLDDSLTQHQIDILEYYCTYIIDFEAYMMEPYEEPPRPKNFKKIKIFK
jgi:hypothetical protein